MSLFTQGEVKVRNQEAFAFVAQIKRCGEKKDIHRGTRIHAHVLRRGLLLEENPHLCNSLINMYAKCGILSKAQELHEKSGSRNVVSWNALVSGYAQEEKAYETFHCFQQMKTEGLSPNAITFVCILKVCGNTGNIEKGQQIHEEIVQYGLQRNNIVVGNALIDMYGKCGMLDKAQNVLEELLNRDVVSWSTLILSYAKQGHSHEALNCFERMQSEGFVPDAIAYNGILKACGDIGDIRKGEEIHCEIASKGFLAKNVLLGTSLVDMYAKCGMLVKAQEVLIHLPFRDVIAWSALITGYAQHGNFDEALNAFEHMTSDGISPNKVTFVCILKICGNIGDLVNGEKIHHEIVSKGLVEKDVVLGTALVDMYAKCGAMEMAQQLHDEHCDKILDSWNALIAGYTHHGRVKKALDCLEFVHRQRIFPDVTTLTCTLKACGSIGVISKGEKIHDHIVSLDLLEKYTYLGNALVCMYIQAGALAKAQLVLDEIDAPNVVTWSTLISGYVQHGQEHEALKCFQKMEGKGSSPDEIIFMLILKACSYARCIDKGQVIHNEITYKGFLVENVMLGNALVNMYAKCDRLGEARHVHNGFRVRSVSSWNALIGGYAKQGQGKDALDCFELMLRESVSPDAITFVFILEVCGRIGSINKGEQFHDKILSQGLLEENFILGTALVDMYAKCGKLNKAQEVLEKLPFRDVISWSVLISGYAHHEQGQEAMNCFERMELEGFSPDEVTFISILKACGSMGAIGKVKHIHDEIIQRGFLETNVILGNALVDMYVKSGMLIKARQVFEELPLQNVVSWCTLISGYAQGHGHEALKCFDQMHDSGISPNITTLLCILKACGSIGAIHKGKRIHEEIASRSMLSKDIMLCTAIVDMYAKCGVFGKAQQVLEEHPSPGIVPWNALMSEYAKQGQMHNALKCFEKMKSKGISMNVITFLCILKVCGSIGAIEKGKQVHEEIVNMGFLKADTDIALGNAIVDMYAKFGVLSKAQALLEELPVRDVVSWNALIGGYAQHGHGHKALICFRLMQSEGICPDRITFLCLLNVCTHSGLVNEAKMCLENMSKNYGIIPNLKHHSCLITLLGCAGYFDEVMSVIKTMPASYSSVQIALMGACDRWGHWKLAGSIFNQQNDYFAFEGS